MSSPAGEAGADEATSSEAVLATDARPGHPADTDPTRPAATADTADAAVPVDAADAAVPVDAADAAVPVDAADATDADAPGLSSGAAPDNDPAAIARDVGDVGDVLDEAEEAERRDEAGAPDPVAAFDALYELSATELVRQTYLLTGRRALAREAVDQAFQHAWRHWPEASADPDPAGWVRAVAHEYALSPWHRLRPGRRRPGAPLPDRRDRELLEALTTLPPPCRRTLLLHDGQGLTLSETAAETEASSAATRGRLRNARQRVGERVPELVALERLRGRLAELGTGEEFGLRPPKRLRTLGERRARQWTRAALALTTAVVAATAWTVTTAPRQYEPPVPAGRPVAGVPVFGGQGKAAGPGGEPARTGDSRTTTQQDRGEGADKAKDKDKAGDRKADKRARDAKRAAEREAKLREQLTQGPRSGPARLFPRAD